MDLNYIDTSYLAPYYLPEKNSEMVEKNLRELPVESLAICPLVRTEFASLLSRKCRMKEMVESDAHRAMTALDRHLKAGMLRMISIDSRDFRQAAEWIIAMKHPLRAPDTVHLAVAARQDAVLWTLDRSLARAARWAGVKTPKYQ